MDHTCIRLTECGHRRLGPLAMPGDGICRRTVASDPRLRGSMASRRRVSGLKATSGGRSLGHCRRPSRRIRRWPIPGRGRPALLGQPPVRAQARHSLAQAAPGTWLWQWAHLLAPLGRLAGLGRAAAPAPMRLDRRGKPAASHRVIPAASIGIATDIKKQQGGTASHSPALLLSGRLGDPGATRTRDTQFRKLLLYPPELRGLVR